MHWAMLARDSFIGIRPMKTRLGGLCSVNCSAVALLVSLEQGALHFSFAL